MANDPAAPRRSSGGSLDGIAPIAAFLLANRLAGLRWAVAAATAASVAVTVIRIRRGQPLGRFLPILTALVIGRGIVGIATGSEDVYFGLGIAGKIAFGLALIVSAVLRRPLASRLAPYVLDAPPGAASHPLWRSAMSWITAVGGLYYLSSGALDIVLYRNSSVERYVVVRFLANWPLSLVAIAAAAAIAQRRLTRIDGIDSVAAMVERRMAAMAGQNPPKSIESSG